MRHYLAVTDYTPQELQHLLDLALRLKRERQRGGNRPILKGQVLGMVFQKPSLRTRVSFDMAMRHLGGDALYLSPAEIGLGGRESVADVARVLSGYVQAIMARTFSHQHILELAQYASVPVINGLSDYNHPCQALADALTIVEHKGGLKGVNVTFIGDGNNVAVSLMHICAKLGANFTLAAPEGYDLNPEAIALARSVAEDSGSTLLFVRDPHEAVTGADVLYTDTWTSMGQEAETEKRGDERGQPHDVRDRDPREADERDQRQRDRERVHLLRVIPHARPAGSRRRGRRTTCPPASRPSGRGCGRSCRATC